ncbi:hypothetical protein HMPREF9709_01216 [Helcococcus kunzii ATCC 51366]|uniref:Ribbon-helix-helix protein CopG domain-containing protein n=1 Tax=Helcococcus kunzii ATCC 51366 TaxID=883114 RepID=H3NPF5_9FIRM|nr:hypothetical protein [Helcococcus kunzii]EHR33468.1 hypothetical protein HMPREF9709_01216 [Helcococcus kunzii ATCC 51366]QUY65119.1 CopG family transcriptional regulator [Helcococcus kunzii]
MQNLRTEKLTIRKIKTYTIRHGRQVRVSEETYERIKDLADETGRNIGEISEMIMDWAIDNVVVVED